MRILFCLDVKLKKFKDKYFTSGAADYQYFNNQKIFKNDILNVICRSDDENFSTKMSVSSGKNVNFTTINSYFSLLNPKFKNELKEMINNSDLCLIKLPTIIGCFACHYVKKMKKRYVIEMVGDPYYSLKYRGDLISKIMAPIIKSINKYYIKRAAAVIYVSKKYLQDRYPTKGKSFTLSDVSLIKCNESIIEKRYKRIKKYNKMVVYKFGIIGSLNVRYKGLDTALFMINELKRNNINVELHILGTGNRSYWDKIIESLNISNNVLYDGVIEHEEIFDWFDKIDFFLMPSLTEGLPRSLIEAMSRGCLCIASNVGGIPELLETNSLVNPKDYMSMKNIVLNMIENIDDSVKQSKRNIDISNDFQIERLRLQKKKINEIILKEIINYEDLTCSK